MKSAEMLFNAALFVTLIVEFIVQISNTLQTFDFTHILTFQNK